MKMIGVAFNTKTLKLESQITDVIRETPGVVNVADGVKMFPRTRILKNELDKVQFNTSRGKNPKTCDNLDIYIWSTCEESELKQRAMSMCKQILIFAKGEINSRGRELVKLKAGIDRLIKN